MSKTTNRMRATAASVDEDDDLGGAAGQSSGGHAHSVVSWEPGEDLPPFSIDNPAAVNLCVQIISGVVGDLPAIIVSEAVAVQIYRLVRDRKAPPELKGSEIRTVYVILASLARRALVAPDAAAAMRLDKVLGRKASARAPGLHHALKEKAKQRKGDAEMSLMSYDDATTHLLKQWDLLLLSKLLPDDFGTVASGDGGGDPGGGGGGDAGLATSPPPRSSHAQLDPRTRALDRHLGTLALAARRLARLDGKRPSVFAEQCGDIGLDVLLLIDEHVRAVPLPHQAKRDATFERQLVAARKLLDVERQLRAEAEVRLMRHALEPQRDRRALEQERADAAAFQRQAAAATAELHVERAAERKRERAAFAAERRQLLADARQSAIEADEGVTRLEAEITRLEREPKRLEKSLQAAHVQQAAAEAEAARVREHGRAWARVREEQARADQAEAARDEALCRIDELEQQLAQRSAGGAAEHQELLAARGRVKDLREKVESYQARSNRRFFDIDPVQEENQRLRQELAQLEEATRGQLAAAEAAAAQLRTIAEPTKERFFVRGHFAARIDLACIQALQLGVSRGKVPALFLIFARLFGVKLPGRLKKVPSARGSTARGRPSRSTCSTCRARRTSRRWRAS